MQRRHTSSEETMVAPVFVAVTVYEVCTDSTDGVPAMTPDDVENVMPGQPTESLKKRTTRELCCSPVGKPGLIE
jgi:hypothetical protein